MWLPNSLKFKPLLLVALVTISFWHPCQARPLRVYTPDWPPFYIQENDKKDQRGMAWDILERCTRSLGNSTVFDNYPIRRMLKLMEEGELDVNIMSFKSDREKILSYGREVVFENNYVVIVGGHVKKNIRKLSDLDGLSIAQLVGLRPSDSFKLWFNARLNKKSELDTLLLNSEEQILKMLANGRIDATVLSEAEFRWRSRKLGLVGRIKNTKLLIQKQPYFFVMAKQSPIYKARPATLSKMDSCVKNLKRTGAWGELRSRYQL